MIKHILADGTELKSMKRDTVRKGLKACVLQAGRKRGVRGSRKTLKGSWSRRCS